MKEKKGKKTFFFLFSDFFSYFLCGLQISDVLGQRIDFRRTLVSLAIFGGFAVVKLKVEGQMARGRGIAVKVITNNGTAYFRMTWILKRF